MNRKSVFNGGPVIVIKTICSQTLESFPPLYITTLEEALLILQTYPQGSCYIDAILEELVVIIFKEIA